MKILYFIHHLRADGTQRVLAELAEGLKNRGHEQALLCLNDSWDKPLLDRLRGALLEIRFVGKIALTCGYGFLSTWRWIRQQHFDVAVTLLFFSDVIGRAVARAAGVPRIVSSLRARNTNYASWQRWLVRRTMPWADAVVLNSTQVRDFAIIGEGVHPERIYVIPNGIKVADYAVLADRSRLCAELGLPPNSYLIGSVGRMDFQKGFDVLLKALALLCRSDLHLLLVGSGREAERLQRQATALGLGQQVHLTGYRQDVPCLLGILDLYVQPSRFEGMPNTLLEAMAAGCPVVASGVDRICELIEDGSHGWLVPPEDPRALAEAIKTGLANLPEAHRRAAAAQERITAKFSTEAMIASWEKVLAGREI